MWVVFVVGVLLTEAANYKIIGIKNVTWQIIETGHITWTLAVDL